MKALTCARFAWPLTREQLCYPPCRPNEELAEVEEELGAGTAK